MIATIVGILLSVVYIYIKTEEEYNNKYKKNPKGLSQHKGWKQKLYR